MSSYILETDESKATDQEKPVTVTFTPETPEFYPPAMIGWDQWIPTAGSSKKQPDARAYSDLPGDPDDCDEGEDSAWSWSNPDNWTTHDHALEIVENARPGKYTGVAFIPQKENDPYREPADPFVLIDLDDAANIDYNDDEIIATIHPVAWRIIEAGGYGALSSSGADHNDPESGLHVLVQGELPEGTKTINGDLPEHPDFPGASIEVYDGKHVAKVTPYHIPGTAENVQPAGDLLDSLADAFGTSHTKSPGGDREPAKDRDTIRETEYTTDFEDVVDAILHTSYSDITLRSDVTDERKVRSDTGTGSVNGVDIDPSWTTSKSGTRIWWGDDGNIIDRSGPTGLDALQLVALEERIITNENDYPEGSDWFEAIDALRDRGAHIPELVRNYPDLIAAQMDGFEPTKEDGERVRERDEKQRERWDQ